MGFEIRCFGGFGMTHEGTPVDLPTEKAKLLLAYLITQPHQTFTRNHIAGLLWSDFEDEKAKTNLRATLSRIKKVIQKFDKDAAVISAGRTEIRLNPDFQYTLDVSEFETFQKAFEKNRDTESLQAAVDCYRGDYLQGFYEDWCLVEQEHWRSVFLRLLGQLIDHHSADGDLSTAIDLCIRGLQLNELQEDLHQKLMLLYLRAGDRAKALAQYEQCKTLLDEAFGTPPLPETQAIYEQLTQQTEGEGDLQQLLADAAQLPFREETVTYINRQDELGQLKSIWEQVDAVQGRLLFVRGEAGLGKSRLIQTFISTVVQKDADVIWGKCFPLEQQMVLSPWLQMFRGRSDTLEKLQSLDTPWRNEINQLLPELSGEGDIEQNPELDAASNLNRRLEAMVQLLLQWLQEKPLVVVLDDVHWADETSLRLLNYLARQLTQTPLLILATYRPEDLEDNPLLAETKDQLIQARLAQEFQLPPLANDYLEQLIDTALAGGEQAVDVQVHHIRQFGGNPLFVLSTLRAWIEHGLLKKSDDAWAMQSQEDDVLIPENIQNLLSTRLKRFPLPVQQVLQMASVVQGTFGPEGIATALGTSPLDVVDMLEQLVQKQVLTQTKDGFTFRHELLRRITYQQLSEAKRQYLHKMWAETLVQQPESDNIIKALAHHFDQANVLDQALAYTFQAATLSYQEHAHMEALQHLEQAERLLNEQITLSAKDKLLKQFELLLLKANVFRVLGDPEFEACVQTLKDLAQSVNHAEYKHQAVLLEIQYLRLQGRLNDAMDVIEQAMKSAKSKPNMLIQLQREEDLIYQALGQYDKALASAEALYHQAEALEDLDAMRVSLLDLGIIHWHQGDYGKVFELYQRALTLCRTVGDQHNEGLVLVNLGNAHWGVGQFDEASDCYGQGFNLLKEVGYLRGEAIALICQGVLLRDQGDLVAALDVYEQAQALLEKVEDQYSLSDLLCKIGEILRDLGETDAARDHFERGIELSRSLGARAIEAYHLAHQASLDKALGNLDQAQQRIEQSLGIVEDLNDSIFLIEACFIQYQIFETQGQKTKARAALKKAHQALMAQAESIQEDAFKQAFLHQVPLNQKVIEAWEK